jgi:hypothetical protein
VHNSDVLRASEMVKKRPTREEAAKISDYIDELTKNPSMERDIEKLILDLRVELAELKFDYNIMKQGFLPRRASASFNLDYEAIYLKMKTLGYRFYVIPKENPFADEIAGLINYQDKIVIIGSSKYDELVFKRLIHEFRHFVSLEEFAASEGFILNSKDYAEILGIYFSEADYPNRMYYWASDLSYHFVKPKAGLYSVMSIAPKAASEFNSFRADLNYFDSIRRLHLNDIRFHQHWKVIDYYWDDYSNMPGYYKAMAVKPKVVLQSGFEKPNPYVSQEMTSIICPNCDAPLPK